MSEATVRRTTVDVDAGTVKEYVWHPQVGQRYALVGRVFRVLGNDPMFAVSRVVDEATNEETTASWELIASARNVDGGFVLQPDGFKGHVGKPRRFSWPAPQYTGEEE